MDRKGIAGIVMAVLGLISWQIYYSREVQKAAVAQKAAAELAAAAAAKAPPAATGANAPVGAAAPSGTTVPVAGTPAVAVPAERPEEKIETLSNALVEYTFSSLGGGIAKAKLVTHKAEGASRVVLNEFGSLPIGAMSEVAGEAVREPYSVTTNAKAGVITFERTDGRQLQIVKKFSVPQLEGADKATLLKSEYLVRMDVTFTNRAAQPLPLPGYFVYTGAAEPVHARDLPTYTGFTYYHAGGSKFIDVNWFGAGGLPLVGHAERAFYRENAERIRWAGVTNQYFTTLVTADVDEKANSDVQAKHVGTQVWAKRFEIADAAWREAGHSVEGKSSAAQYGIDGAIGMPGVVLQPGESFSQSFSVYTGPREYRRLKALGNEEDEVMAFGMFGIVSKTLLNSMNTLRAWIGNYALAIVVLTLIIKTLLWPLQNKATQSMKRMQALQPKMTELRETYKDDPTRMNTELMKLYKDYGVNPVAGCLPMLVQIPIFFGFYNMLGKAVELRDSHFLWVKDLSQPDTVAHIFGYPLNVLPLCMAVTMLIQMAIQPKSGDQTQQRIMMFMPLIFIAFCYNFASALALYWTVQNLFSIVQLYATRNQAAPVLTKVTAPVGKKKKK